METLTKAYVKVREYGKKLTKGQTMTEYALILAAVAVVVFVTYEVSGIQQRGGNFSSSIQSGRRGRLAPSPSIFSGNESFQNLAQLTL